MDWIEVKPCDAKCELKWISFAIALQYSSMLTDIAHCSWNRSIENVHFRTRIPESSIDSIRMNAFVFRLICMWMGWHNCEIFPSSAVQKNEGKIQDKRKSIEFETRSSYNEQILIPDSDDAIDAVCGALTLSLYDIVCVVNCTRESYRTSN